jgi:hypothetical protein
LWQISPDRKALFQTVLHHPTSLLFLEFIDKFELEIHFNILKLVKMRIVNKIPERREFENDDEVVVMTNISFTANAIEYIDDYLFSSRTRINLKEWIWHEEMVDGTKTLIITDKVILDR